MAVAPIAQPAGGGNPSGFNVQTLAPTQTGGSFGDPGNPMVAPWPGGTAMPNPSQASGGNPSTPGGIPGNPWGFPMGKGKWGPGKDALRDAFHKAGFPSAIADMMAVFIGKGAGYSPEVLQALFAQLQPQIERGQADIMEHFGSQGMGMSSPAAIGFGDFMSQVNLNEGQIAAQLYEQSVQNFMSLITKGNELSLAKAGKSGGGIGSLLGGAGNLLSGLSSLGSLGGAGAADLTAGMSMGASGAEGVAEGLAAIAAF